MASPPALPAMATAVVRKDIRSLTAEEQAVYVNAVKQMMVPGWSAKPEHQIPAKFPCEFIRLASYHGWPGKDVGGSPPDEEDYWSGYCAHGIETFPTWHRAYMTDYEQTLQAADRFLRGKDKANADPVALHYWGWDNQALFPDEPFPKAMIDFNGVYFKDYAPMITDWLTKYQPVAPKPGDDPLHIKAYQAIMEALEMVRQDQWELSGSDDIDRQLQDNQVPQRLNAAWTAKTFPPFSNTTLGGYACLESPHNAVHNACGNIMSDPNVASFHPIFFLHHSNVDRLLEAWLEAKSHQNAVPWLQFYNNNPTLYEELLTPFVHPADASVQMSSRYTFQDTTKLGYRYDQLPVVPKPPTPITPMARVEKRTTQVQFQALSRAAMVVSLNIHVFVLPKDEAFNPPADVRQFSSLKSFAGTIALFGSKGPACDTCAQVEPHTISTDATDALVAQQLLRSKARIEVVVQKATNGAIISFEESDLPTPVFAQVAVLGHVAHAAHAAGARAAAAHHVDAASVAKVTDLQNYLKRHGWYAGEVDGVYGPATDSAVQRFQGRFGLPLAQADDDHYFVNEETKALMATARYNSRRDVGSFERTYGLRSTVTWFVDTAPAGAAADATAAITQWAGAISHLSFQQAASHEAADLVIRWGALPAGDAAAEGFGSPLAHVDVSAGKATITLDASKVGAYRSLPVLLHSIGSALGLGNSFDSADVMYPFYKEAAVALTAADKAKGAAKYP